MQDWTKQWESLAKQFTGAMNDLGRGGNSADPAAVWQKATQPFSNIFGAVPAPAEVLDRLSASAKGYFALLQSLASSAGVAGMKTDDATAAWTEALRKGFNIPGIDPSLLDNPVASAMRDLAGQGAKGFEAMMGEFGRVAGPFKAEWQSLFGQPAFGLGREHQERWQALARAMAEYQEHSNRYQALILQSSRDGFERFQSKLAEREEPGRQLESVRQVYDLWIDAAEEAYGDVALSPEFREAYGNMVNAQMRVRSLVQGEVERMGAQLGMPTRSEVRSLEKAVHELRRAAKKSTTAATAGSDKAVAQLKAEIAALRAEVVVLKSGKSPAAASNTTAKVTPWPRKAKPAAASSPKSAKTSARKR
jgi:class III poly(R)-hydroxyalkanoic acid synthase PhaE subunit